jgi:hypothetical protein
MRHAVHSKCPTCAAKERTRIRRLIGPALREAKSNVGLIGWNVDAAARAYAALERIDAATRPESKRKAKPSVYPWCSCGKCAPCPDRGSPDCPHDDEHPYRFNLKRCRDAYEVATSNRKAKAK